MKADAVAALATSIQTGVVAVAAVIAWRQVKEARKLREEQAQPYVVVSLELDDQVHSAINLVIRNLGSTVARDVILDFDPPLVSSLDVEASDIRVSDWQALTAGIPTLVPGQEMGTLFDFLVARYADEQRYPRETEVTVTYSSDIGGVGRLHEYKYNLDFGAFYNRHSAGKKGMTEAVDQLSHIRKALESWNEHGSLRVVSKGLDESRAELARQIEDFMGKSQNRQQVSGKRRNLRWKWRRQR